jgi:hypothetical protein
MPATVRLRQSKKQRRGQGFWRIMGRTMQGLALPHLDKDQMK